jgi:hypothetical protein
LIFMGERMDDRPLFEGVVWRSICNNGNCVEVASQDGWFGLRDSKDGGTGPVLAFTGKEWEAFVRAAKNGAFDV